MAGRVDDVEGQVLPLDGLPLHEVLVDLGATELVGIEPELADHAGVAVELHLVGGVHVGPGPGLLPDDRHPQHVVDVAVGQQDVMDVERLPFDQVRHGLELKARVEQQGRFGVAPLDQEAVLVEVGVGKGAQLDLVGEGLFQSEPARWRSASYRTMDTATAALSELTRPSIGRRTSWSQRSRTRRCRPLPSAPTTTAVLPRRSQAK